MTNYPTGPDKAHDASLLSSLEEFLSFLFLSLFFLFLSLLFLFLFLVVLVLVSLLPLSLPETNIPVSYTHLTLPTTPYV